MGSLIKDIGYAAGSRGSTTVARKVKNKPLQGYIDQNISGYGNMVNAGETSLADYISKYLADTKDAEMRSGQEIGAVDRFYTGGVTRDLAGLRAQRAAAVAEAARRGGLYGMANINRARLGAPGGTSSYDRQILAKNFADVAAQAALDDAAASRSDYGYVTDQQLRLQGIRQALADAVTSRGLVPEDLRRKMYAQNLGFLGNLGELDRANKFYGLQYNPSGAEQAGNIVGGVGSAVANYYTGGLSGLLGETGGPMAGGWTNASRTAAQAGPAQATMPVPAASGGGGGGL